MNELIELYNSVNKHLLYDDVPSEYFNQIYNIPLFCKYPFDMLHKLKNTNQSLKYHPEGNVWNHTMLVVDEAAKVRTLSKDSRTFMWAALLHDIGKPNTTKNKGGRITSYDHDKVGAELATNFLKKFTDDNKFIKSVTSLIRWHMQVLFVVNGLSFADIKAMKKHTDVNEVALLGFCDRLGRLDVDIMKEKNNIELFVKKCNEN